MAKGRASAEPNQNDSLAQKLPLVSARWLLSALLGIFGGGLVLVYLTMCLLFWQGAWQILYKPGHTESASPSSSAIPFENLKFAPTETGQASLNGWLIPAGTGSPYASRTVLYLHGMDAASLSETLPALMDLHRLGLNVFAFDYRGFGFSAYAKPSEQTTTEDTDAAWEYLVGTRHIPAASIILCGIGLGASLAAEAAARHPDATAVILDAPGPTALELFRADPRSRWMPVRLLTHDRFDPAAALQKLQQPKLFFLPQDASATSRDYAQFAADPKVIVYLPAARGNNGNSALKTAALRRFLDELH